jgi:hypothetical protein
LQTGREKLNRALVPPSTYTVCPVMKSAASSESRNATIGATSAGRPTRPAGIDPA